MQFDPSKSGEKIADAWLQGGAWLDPQPWSPGYHILLTRENTFVQLAGQRGGKKLHVRVGSIGEDKKTEAFDVALTGALQGTPALGPGFLLLPTAEANGVVAQDQSRRSFAEQRGRLAPPAPRSTPTGTSSC